LFGFNPLIFYTETLNNCSPALGGLRYFQFCAKTIMFKHVVVFQITGFHGGGKEDNGVVFGQLIDLKKKKIPEFCSYLLAVQ